MRTAARHGESGTPASAGRDEVAEGAKRLKCGVFPRFRTSHATPKRGNTPHFKRFARFDSGIKQPVTDVFPHLSVYHFSVKVFTKVTCFCRYRGMNPILDRISVVEGDITRQPVDAIVNAANSSL